MIDYALGITKINPLQPHYRCETCKHVEFVADEQIDTGFLLPAKNCPECGHKMLGDGQNLRVESFLGYRHDRGPSLALGVPSGRFEDAVTYMERMFHAKQKDIHKLDFPIEEGYLFIYVDIVPIDKLFADKKVFPFSEMDDPTVFGYLSQPEAFDCYLPYEPDIPIIKELLECIEINHYSDLFKICGLIHSSAWLPYILPSIRNGSVKYRKTITAREDIYHHLLKHQIDPEAAYKVMEMTRKGRASKEFEEYKQKMIEWKAERRFVHSEEDFVFVGEKNRLIEPRVFYDYYQEIMEQAGIEDANFHTLRHTFATRCIENGMDILMVAKTLGHSNVSTTLNKYSHLLPQHQKASMEKLEAIYF